MNIDKLKELLMPEEGFSALPYKDTNGYWTNGYGNNLDAKGMSINEAKNRWPNGISKEQAEALLEQDIMNAFDQLKSYLPTFQSLDDVRQTVLIDMTFNMGIKGLLGFHDFLYFMGKCDYKHAAIEMLDSLWAREVKGRAIKLAKMIETGEWP